jgi:hypothetical protein
MIRVYVHVEGQTEATFVRTVLQLHFNQWQIYLYPISSQGIKRYPIAKRDLLATLKQHGDAFCTMMLDYYGMPPSWPGREAATQKPYAEKAASIENAVLEDIAAQLGDKFNRSRFIPYVQMHEFEALLFSDPGRLALGLGLADEFKIRCACAAANNSPEEINDSEQTAPSKRIKALYAGYQKPRQGVLISQSIGLEAMRAQCPHFNEWLRKLEALANRG